jgi:type II secretion system protein G
MRHKPRETRRGPQSEIQSHTHTHTQSESQLGFTLFELIIVLLILGILVALGLKAFRSAQLKARDRQRKSDLDNVADALELYYNDHGEYPQSTPLAGGQVDPGATCSVAAWGSAFECDEVYMVSMPQDPKGWTYFYESDQQQFALYAMLENEQDDDYQAGGYSGTDCEPGAGETLCVYRLTSSNYQ